MAVEVQRPTRVRLHRIPHHPGDTIAVHYRAADGGDRTANITLAEGPPA